MKLTPFILFINDFINMSFILIYNNVFFITKFCLTKMAFESLNIHILQLTNTCFLYNTSKTLYFIFFMYNTHMLSANILHCFNSIHVFFLSSVIKSTIYFTILNQLIYNIQFHICIPTNIIQMFFIQWFNKFIISCLLIKIIHRIWITISYM